MKYFLYFASTIFAMALSCSASAYMKYTYETALMKWAWDETSYYEDGTSARSEALWYSEFQFSIDFIIPEINFDLDDGEVRVYEFHNPVVSVTTSDLFQTVSVESSHFFMETWKAEGDIYKSWYLNLDITSPGFPLGEGLSASIKSGNDSDSMQLRLDKFRHTSRGFTQIIDVDAFFSGYYYGPPFPEPDGIYRLTSQKISVPEPFSPLLLLTGLAGIFVTRKRLYKTPLSQH